MNSQIMAKTAQLSDFDESLFGLHLHAEATPDTQKYLIATSEQPLSAMHMDEHLEADQLPIRYGGFSTCFRKEAGKHGKDAWGIFRVHQFEKIEQFCITSPENSAEMLKQMVKISEEFYESVCVIKNIWYMQLGLSFRVVNIASGSLNNAAAMKYDLEAWFPTLKQYRELASLSNCTDYQSRALNIRLGYTATEKEKKEKKYVHMLNATLCATQRTICCLLENYQTKDGVIVPKVLVFIYFEFLFIQRPYMGTHFLPYLHPPKSKTLKSTNQARSFHSRSSLHATLCIIPQLRKIALSLLRFLR